MLLRICLIVAILGGGAVVGVNFVMVKKAIVTTIEQRDKEAGLKEAAQKDRDKTKTERDALSGKLTTTSNTLNATRSALVNANAKAESLDKEKTDLSDRLDKANAARDQAQGELTQWRQLKVTPDMVIQLTNQLNLVNMKFAGARQEATIIHADDLAINAKYKAVSTLSNEDVKLPDGLKGKVLAVDPKYDFVILDIGVANGVLPKGIMMVARDGKLIGKVQIASVTGTQCIANIMPDWRRGDVMEGDEVFY
jgi:hypothetical protein